MPRYAWKKAPAEVKGRYFELIRRGLSGAAASEGVGVSLRCGSLWFIDAGSVSSIEWPISSRYLNQDDRIEIADGLAAGESVKSIAAPLDRAISASTGRSLATASPTGRPASRPAAPDLLSASASSSSTEAGRSPLQAVDEPDADGSPTAELSASGRSTVGKWTA